jgi:hypothetical protein
MKTLIQILGNGDCLFNAILVGYVDAHNGQYPIVNGMEIRTQLQLREIVQQHYQRRIDAADETLIACLKGMLIDIIKLKNFSGFNKARSLQNALKIIREKYDSLTEEQNREGFLDTKVNQDLMQLYVDSITSVWGSWQETMILRDLLSANIRLSGQGTPEENEIEVTYVAGNHYNVYVNNPVNDEVLALISATGGEQLSQDDTSLTKEQLLKISALGDYQFHLFLQIIFNKREEEQRDINSAITDEEVAYAMEYLKTYKVLILKKNVHSETKLGDSHTEYDDQEVSPIKPKKLNSIFAAQQGKVGINRSILTNEEKYNLYYDDTSSEEGDQKGVDNSNLTTIKEGIDKLKDKIGSIEEIDITDENIELSFLAHEFGIRILKASEVYKHYRSLKHKNLAKNTVLNDKQITKCFKSAFKEAVKKTYEDPNSIYENNADNVKTLLAEILEDKRAFIKAVRKKTIAKVFPTIKKLLILPSKSIKYTDKELQELVIEILKEIRGVGDVKSALDNKPGGDITLKCDNKNSRPKLEKYESSSPIKKKLADQLLGKDKRVISTFLKELPMDIKEYKAHFTDILMSNLENELSVALNNLSNNYVHRETLPTTFHISFDVENDITQFLAYIRLLTASNNRLIKNYKDNTNILNDEVDTLSRSFSFLGLTNSGIESQEVSKKTGTRSDIVAIGTVDGSTSYSAIAKIINQIDMTDAEISKWIIEILEGRGKEFIDEFEINNFQKKSLEKFMNSLVYLMFSTEVARNPASLVINYIILELIREGELDWQDAFEQREMPMSIVGAISPSRWMHTNYETTLKYSYDKADNSISNENGKRDMEKLQELINKEASIFSRWLLFKGIEYETDLLSKVIALIAKKCSAWYGVKIASKRLLVELFLDIFGQEIEDKIIELSESKLEKLLTLTSEEDTKVILDWYNEENLYELDNDVLIQILDLGHNELKVLSRMVSYDSWDEQEIIRSLLDTGLDLSKSIIMLKNAINHLDGSSNANFDLKDIANLDFDQLEQLAKMISEDEDVLLKLNSDIKLEELLEIYSDYSDDQEKIEAFLDEEFLSLKAEYKRTTKDAMSFKDFYVLYNESKNKVRYLLDNEYRHHLIKMCNFDFEAVSIAYDAVCEENEVEREQIFDIDDEDLDIYELIYEKLKDHSVINSEANSSEDELEYEYEREEEVSMNLCFIKYDNQILNSPKGRMLFELTSKNKNADAINLLLELGKDSFIAEQILLAVDELGAEQVLEILFDSKIRNLDLENSITKNLRISAAIKDEQILEAIAKIEATIGKGVLSEIIGFYQYTSRALSNHPFSDSAQNIIKVIGDLTQDLQEALDLSNLYEYFDANKITIFITQLESLIEFVASGPIQVGFFPRPPHFDPGDDFSGNNVGGAYNANHLNNIDNNSSQVLPILLIGLSNSTTSGEV